MARPTSFGKRENEKKKQEKRQEKLKRKEDRKSTTMKGASLEEMFAYVDENGNITSTPPEFQPKTEEVDIESIVISTPKKTEDDGPSVLQGKVERFIEDKGYGFIKDQASGNKYFFHISAAPREIREGEKVFFELERGPRDMNAVRIRYEE